MESDLPTSDRITDLFAAAETMEARGVFNLWMGNVLVEVIGQTGRCLPLKMGSSILGTCTAMFNDGMQPDEAAADLIGYLWGSQTE